jgi:hypothetical protein
MLFGIAGHRPVAVLMRVTSGGVVEDEQQDWWIRSHLAMRRSVGIIGILLPAALALVQWLLVGLGWKRPVPGHFGFAGSISAYYYYGPGAIFIGSMFAFGVFLLAYRYKRADRWISSIAGLLAIVVGTCPTVYPGDPLNALGVVHLTSATVFLGLLGLFCVWLFPRHIEGDVRPQDEVYWKAFYIACGVVLYVCLVAAGLFVADHGKDDATVPGTDTFPWIYVWEAGAVMAFGLAWLVKGMTFQRFLRSLKQGDAPSSPSGPDPDPDGDRAAQKQSLGG